jgi:hypothetical protein
MSSCSWHLLSRNDDIHVIGVQLLFDIWAYALHLGFGCSRMELNGRARRCLSMGGKVLVVDSGQAQPRLNLERWGFTATVEIAQ